MGRLRSGRWKDWALVRALFLVCLLPVSSSRDRKREQTLVSSASKNTNPIMGTLPSRPHVNLIICQGPYLQISPHWGSELQQLISRGGATQTFSSEHFLNPSKARTPGLPMNLNGNQCSFLKETHQCSFATSLEIKRKASNENTLMEA